MWDEFFGPPQHFHPQFQPLQIQKRDDPVWESRDYAISRNWKIRHSKSTAVDWGMRAQDANAQRNSASFGQVSSQRAVRDFSADTAEPDFDLPRSQLIEEPLSPVVRSQKNSLWFLQRIPLWFHHRLQNLTGNRLSVPCAFLNHRHHQGHIF